MEGLGHVVSASATDLAGNTENTRLTLNIDKTEPMVQVALLPNTESRGMTAHFTAIDGLSGILGDRTIDVSFNEETAEVQIVRGFTDLSGNTGMASIFTFDQFEVEEARLDFKGLGDTGLPEDRVRVEGVFSLRDISDGMNPLNEVVTVAFYDFSEVIPTGSFVRNLADTGFGQRNEEGPGITHFDMTDDGDFKVRVGGILLEGTELEMPVYFSISIGNDLGMTEIPFEGEDRYKN